jgi:putative transposase
VGDLRIVDAVDSHIVDAAGQTRGMDGLSLFDVMQRYKSLTTRKYIQGVRESGWTPFEKRLWKRSYFERVLRNESELETRRHYTLENPLRAATKKGLL